MINTYITTDTHFFHKEKMLKWCGRPDDYEKRIIKGFKSLSSTDILVHLGDICIGEDKYVHDKIISQIPCKKILVRGNHDKKSNTWYLRNGWDFVCTSFFDKCFGLKIMFSHRPYTWDGIYDINIHGHLHNLGHRTDEVDKMHCMNYLISLEKMGYYPISLRSIVDNVRNGVNK